MNGDSPGDLSPQPPPADDEEPTLDEARDAHGLEPLSAETPSDTTAKIDLGLHPPGVAPPLLPIPKPKPVIIPERVDDGWRTANLHLKSASGSYYLTVKAANGKVQVIHLTSSQLDSLLQLVDSAPGLLWKKLSAIPLERPLPSRALEEELRVMLTTFGPELRTRR
jgi:hypothetical protein